MMWQTRFLALVAAGGLVAVTSGCGSDPPDNPSTMKCNANPDPCCLEPDGAACKARKIDAGGAGFDVDAADGTNASTADAIDADAARS